MVNLVKHLFIYGIGNMLGVAGGLFLIPLYTHVLTPSEYGILELISRSADILILVMFNGIRQGFIRHYFDEDHEDWHKTVVSSTLILLCVLSIAVSLVVLVFRETLSALLFQGLAPSVFLVFITLWLPLEMMVKIGMTHFQIQMKSARYVFTSLVIFLLSISSNILLVYVYRKGIAGILVTNMWISGVVGLSFAAILLRWTHIKFSLQVVKDLIKFGAPYAPTAVFMFLLTSSDRYFLSAWASLDAVGIYALAYKIGMFGTSLVVGPFGMIWAPYLFENYQKKEGPELIGKVFTLYTVLVVAVGLVISVLSPIVIPLISDSAYHASFRIVPPICLAAIFYGMSCIADAGILISKKTFYKPLLFGAAGAIAVGSNFVLIPHFGAMGAALTLSVAFLALFILVHSVSSRFYYFKVEYRKVILIFLWAILSYELSYLLLDWAGDETNLKMLSVLPLAIFPVLAWYGGIFSCEEKSMLMRIIGQRLMKMRGAGRVQEVES